MIFSIFLTLGLVGISAGLFYVCLVWNFDYWKKRGVKGPKPTPLFGSFPNMIKQKRHIIQDIEDIYRQYRHDEDFVGVYSIRTPQLLVLSPELVHKVLVTDFKYFHDNEASTWFDKKSDTILANNPFILRGDEWKERRQEVTPGLTSNRIKAVYPVTQEVCEKLVKYIKEKCTNTSIDGIDGNDLGLRYTSEVVTDCVLGLKADSFTDNPTPILAMIKSLFQGNNVFLIYAFLAGFWPAIRSIYKAKFFKKDTTLFFHGLMNSAISLRRKQKVDRIDFLNYILQLQDKKNLTNEEVASHSMTFLLDGFETTASVIIHCLYQLAKKPSTQEKLRKELISNANEKGDIDFDVLNELPYLDQCIHESLRIIPPALFSTKLCTEAYELTNKNGNKVQLNPNDIVIIPVFALHHDERFFPNPNEFNPERFNPENGGTKEPHDMGTYLPFSDGPRICLGMKFALTQTKAALVKIVRNFNVKLNPKTRTDNQLDPTYFLGTLNGGVWLDFEERK